MAKQTHAIINGLEFAVAGVDIVLQELSMEVADYCE